MKIEFTESEVFVLDKVLRFVRFQSTEYEARFLAGSPHIAEMYKKVNEAVGEYHKLMNTPFPTDWPYIETIKGYLDIIKIRIKDTDNWNDLESHQRIEYLKTLIYPYKISEQSFNDLIRFGDETHMVH